MPRGFKPTPLALLRQQACAAAPKRGLAKIYDVLIATRRRQETWRQVTRRQETLVLKLFEFPHSWNAVVLPLGCATPLRLLSFFGCQSLGVPGSLICSRRWHSSTGSCGVFGSWAQIGSSFMFQVLTRKESYGSSDLPCRMADSPRVP